MFEPRIKEKRWSIDKELELLKKWFEEKLYETDIDLNKPILVIDTPPPYCSGRPHIGGVAHYAHIDMIARAYRMLGYCVIFPFYTDRNGLPVEVQVEKALGKSLHEVDREEFLKLCREFLDKYEEEFVSIFRRWGLSFEYWRNGTDSDEYRRMTQETFIKLWNEGLIYEAERPTLWCPRCGTAIAEAEIEYIEKETYLNYIKFYLEENGKYIEIATTRPELLPACVAIIYNPQDDRYKELKGRYARVPLFNTKVPILEHPAAKPEFGTGLVMICTFGDIRDLTIVNELKLPIRIVINEKGLLNEYSGKYAGLEIDRAREVIIKDLENEGLITRREKIKHKVPVCWRCKTPIEIIITKEFFLKQLDFKNELTKFVEEKMEIYPSEYKQIILEWIKSLEFDWPISRRRYYGTEIPLWYCIENDGIKVLVPKSGKYYRPWKEEPPKYLKDECRGKIVGETRVLDTWFDSSISWMYASRYTRDKAFFVKVYPQSILRPQGYDIIRTWLYYSILRAYLLFKNIPFKYVRISGMGLDEKGEAMHKSKGNIIDPEPPVNKYGADAVRFWAAASAKLGSDYRYSEHLIKTGHDFVVKLWNIARFISTFSEPKIEEAKLTFLDKLILNKVNSIIKRVSNSYLNFDVYEPALILFDFTWHVFADHYLEAVKSRAYNREKLFSEAEQKGAWYTLHTVLKVITKLLAPIMPFITDYIWRVLYGKTIHKELIDSELPVERIENYEEILLKFMKINSVIWKLKNKLGKSLAEPLKAIIYVPKELEMLVKELKVMHKIEDLRIGRPEDIEKYEVFDNEVYIKLQE